MSRDKWRRFLMSDEQIIALIRASEHVEVNRGLEVIYQTYFPNIKSMVMSNSGSEENAADVFQEAVIIFHRELRNGRYLGKSSLKGFLYGISRNVWLKELRKKHHKMVSLTDNSGEIFDESENFSEFSLPNEKRTKLGDFVRLLDDRCQQILEAFYYKKMSVRQIMDTFGIDSEGAAKNRKYRCMQKLSSIIASKKLSRSSFDTD